MKFSSTVFIASIFASAVALPVQVREPQAGSDCPEQQVVTVTVSSLPAAPTNNNLASNPGSLSLQEIDALTPQFGHDAGVNPTGSGDCDGAVNGSDGKPIKVPCACPPPRDQFIQSLSANINAGKAVNNPSVSLTFPTDNSQSSILARFNAASVTLQNLNGPGQGCPIAATTWTAQANAVRNGQSLPAAPSAPTDAPPAAQSSTPSVSAPTTPAQAPSAPTSNSGGANGLSLAQIDALTPQFGHDANVNPTGSGDCDGAVNGSDGKPIKVPCACPPPRDEFIQSLAANIQAGRAVNNPGVSLSFPTSDSTSDQLARFNAASVTLQNLNGPGKGCPIAATTWTAQANAIRNGQSPPPAAPAPAPPAGSSPAPAPPVASSPAPAPPAASQPANSGGVPSIAQLDALAPQFGHDAGVNPTGTGDCDGAVNGTDGKPIKVPCACPPPRDQFLQSLSANIAAGRAVNNPSVALTFPTDDSKNSQITRIQASLVTLQNLNGEGKGCPASSTTFSAQLRALQS